MIKKYKVLLSLCTLITTFYSTQPLTELPTEPSVFINTTEETVVLKLTTPEFQKSYIIIPPRSSAKFINYANPYHTPKLRRVHWAPHRLINSRSNNIPYNGGLDLLTKEPDPKNPKRFIMTTDQEKQELLDKVCSEIVTIHIEEKMEITQLPLKIFEKIVKAAEQYSSGVDNAICQALDEIKTISNTDIPELDPNIDFKRLLSNTAPKTGSKLPAKAPVNCTFGLAKITNAAGKQLTNAGEPLSQSSIQKKIYIIQYTVKKFDNEAMELEFDTQNPELQLITN